MTIFKIIITALNILYALFSIVELAKKREINGADALASLIITMVFISSSVLIWTK